MGLGNFIKTFVSLTAGAIAGTKAVNGRIKPKFGVLPVIGHILIILMLTGFSAGLVFGIINGNYELVFMALIAIPACTYFLLITPYF